MNSSQILDDIYMLKERYHYDNNSFKITLNITEDEFKTKMKSFIDNYKVNIKNIQIIDTKDYFDNNNILKITDNGNMSSHTIKKLKYIKYDNKTRLELYNEREVNINYFNFKQHYDKVIKMKKILFEDNFGHFIEFIVSMEEKETKNENKPKLFYINVITQSSNISNKILNLTNLLNKND